MTEVVGALIKIRNPRARLSRTEVKGRPFGCLGEFLWYLAKSDRVEFIKHYLKKYEEDAERDGRLHGAYGPRLFGNTYGPRGDRMRGPNQVANVIALLKRQDKRTSRRAVMQLFDARDLLRDYKEIPCTCSIQVMIRDGLLHMFVSMRSNDAFLGLPTDVFSFTMLQEVIARALDVEVGEYNHAVGSLHLYDDKHDQARKFLTEGWQRTVPMPAMPPGDPWPAIHLLLAAEAQIRDSGSAKRGPLEGLDNYWMDLVRLLTIHSDGQKGRPERIKKLKNQMSTRLYDPYITHRIVRAAEAQRPQKPVQHELFDHGKEPTATRSNGRRPKP